MSVNIKNNLTKSTFIQYFYLPKIDIYIIYLL